MIINLYFPVWRSKGDIFFFYCITEYLKYVKEKEYNIYFLTKFVCASNFSNLRLIDCVVVSMW